MKIMRSFCVFFTFFFLLPSHLYPMSFLAHKIQNTVHGSIEAAYNLSSSFLAISSTVIGQLPDPIEVAEKIWIATLPQREEEKKAGIGAKMAYAGELCVRAGLTAAGVVVVAAGLGMYVTYQVVAERAAEQAIANMATGGLIDGASVAINTEIVVQGSGSILHSDDGNRDNDDNPQTPQEWAPDDTARLDDVFARFDDNQQDSRRRDPDDRCAVCGKLLMLHVGSMACDDPRKKDKHENNFTDNLRTAIGIVANVGVNAVIGTAIGAPLVAPAIPVIVAAGVAATVGKAIQVGVGVLTRAAGDFNRRDQFSDMSSNSVQEQVDQEKLARYHELNEELGTITSNLISSSNRPYCEGKIPESNFELDHSIARFTVKRAEFLEQKEAEQFVKFAIKKAAAGDFNDLQEKQILSILSSSEVTRAVYKRVGGQESEPHIKKIEKEYEKQCNILNSLVQQGEISPHDKTEKLKALDQEKSEAVCSIMGQQNYKATALVRANCQKAMVAIAAEKKIKAEEESKPEEAQKAANTTTRTTSSAPTTSLDDPAVVQRTTTTSEPVPQAIPGCGKISDEKLKELNIPVQCFPGSPLVPDEPIGYAVLTEEKKEKLLKGCTGIPIQEPKREDPIGFADKPFEQAEISFFASWSGDSDKKNSKPVESSKERYDGFEAENIHKWFREHPVGIQNKDEFFNTGKQNCDKAPLYRVKKDIPGAPAFKKKYDICVDRFHDGDHFEVWDGRKFIGVANTDGTWNEEKTAQANSGRPRRLPR